MQAYPPHTLLFDSLEGPHQNVPVKHTIKMTAAESGKMLGGGAVCLLQAFTNISSGEQSGNS